MSLDGFIAGPDDSMAWAFGPEACPNAAVDEVVRTTGAILAGRRWYELAHDDPDAAPYGGAWSGPIMVMTIARPNRRRMLDSCSCLARSRPVCGPLSRQPAGRASWCLEPASRGSVCMPACLTRCWCMWRRFCLAMACG